MCPPLTEKGRTGGSVLIARHQSAGLPSVEHARPAGRFAGRRLTWPVFEQWLAQRGDLEVGTVNRLWEHELPLLLKGDKRMGVSDVVTSLLSCFACCCVRIPFWAPRF
jgi:hypothetical protein